MPSTIKVLIVDDSALIRQMLTRALSVDPRIVIVGTAKTGVEAINQAKALSPDVITMDIEMPELTGLEALPHIKRQCRARVIMLSTLDNPDVTYEALALGAVDFLAKPKSGVASSLAELSEVLLKKIRTAARIDPIHLASVMHQPERDEAGLGTVGQEPPAALVERSTELRFLVGVA
ncbi:MAG: response regulator, partial [Coriobacteriia bacterium]|nr:response regulator [Coriobacteriia bacterium]